LKLFLKFRDIFSTAPNALAQQMPT